MTEIGPNQVQAPTRDWTTPVLVSAPSTPVNTKAEESINESDIRLSHLLPIDVEMEEVTSRHNISAAPIVTMIAIRGEEPTS
jgi:hypothetical protein